MVVFCCPKCKMVDIGNDNEEKSCFRCKIPMLCLGISSSEWNKYNSTQMSDIVEKRIEEHNSSTNDESPTAPIVPEKNTIEEQQNEPITYQNEEPVIKHNEENKQSDIDISSSKRLKALKCEMCDSIDLIKQDGLFVCQNCGTKYSVEEARKMIENSIDVKGTVKVDISDELNNLYQLARRAKEDSNSENAQKYYGEILLKDPSSWEANFYTTYYQSYNCKIGGIGIAAVRLSNCEETVFNLIKENVTDPTEQIKAVDEVAASLIRISGMLFNAYRKHYYDIGSDIRRNYDQEFANNCGAARDILYYAGDRIIEIFGETYESCAVPCWKSGIVEHSTLINSYIFFSTTRQSHIDIVNKYIEKVKKMDPSYEPPEIEVRQTTTTKNNGCYVATAIYGSYDCPEVWTLRRYRDSHLASSWYGRVFIHIYYAISPTLVKWFGHTQLFNHIFKDRLDRLVDNLKNKGYKDTPYKDTDY